MRTFFIFLVLFAFPVLAQQGVNPIAEGMSSADFDGDGVRETIVKAWRGNSNAHGFYGITIYKSGKDQKWLLLPVGEDVVIKTDEGADCVVRDYRIIRQGQRDVLIAMSRALGVGYADRQVVTFDVYALKKNEQGIPGHADYFFEKEKSVKTHKAYCDVNEAFDVEFKSLMK